MKFTTVARGFVSAAIAAFAVVATAQAPVEISFYYPVAVGGPTCFADSRMNCSAAV